jgi:hypothetical protein
MSALAPRQQSPLPPDEIRDRVLAFFVGAKPPRAGAEAVPEDAIATPTANTNFAYIKHATQL